MTLTVKIKICGLCRPSDIDAVNLEKPEYIGFVFAKSHRQVTPQQALALRGQLRAGIMPVGVFVDEARENIVALVQNGIIDAIQLHGSEDENYIHKLKAVTNVPIIKAVAVQNKGDAQKWAGTAADYLLLDQKSGGTGESFDWDLIGQIERPFFLAGGLNEENITRAIKKLRPFAVDVSSGVVTNRRKDPGKIKEFIRRARNV